MPPRKKGSSEQPKENEQAELTTNAGEKPVNSEPTVVDEKSEQIYQAILSAIDEFDNNEFERISDYDQWQDLFSQYESISNQIFAFRNDESVDEAYRKNKSEELYGELSAIYDDFYLSFTKWNIVHVKTIEDRVEKTQVMNFTVFSIFMTLLTFLLSNIVVAIQTSFDLKKMVITNLTLLLITSILFVFIGTFMGFVGRGNSKKVKVLKTIALFAMPVIVCAALVLVTLFME